MIASKNLAAAAIAALLTAGAAQNANATVRYDFTAFSSFEFSGETFSGSFSLTAPTFVVPNASFPVASLDSCTVVGSGGPADCDKQEFLTGFSPGYDTVSFGLKSPTAGNYGIFYYFVIGDFSTPGLHESQIFGGSQYATLEVTDLGAPPAAVPEPATWALVITGFGLAGAALRRRRAVAA